MEHAKRFRRSNLKRATWAAIQHNLGYTLLFLGGKLGGLSITV
jgi:hypothetical protein